MLMGKKKRCVILKDEACLIRRQLNPGKAFAPGALHSELYVKTYLQVVEFFEKGNKSNPLYEALSKEFPYY